MKIVFLGTPDFAVKLLNHILRKTHHKVIAVVSRPDAPAGRGRRLQSTPVKQTVQEFDPTIPVLQPVKISAPDVINQLKRLNADLFLVIAYGQILKPEVLEIPSKGCFNVHASLLPAYRGAAPIQRALMDGCHETGVTFMRMCKGMDSGDIMLQKACTVSQDENAQALTQKLLGLSFEMIDEALTRIEKGTVRFEAQQHAEATYAPKITSDDLVLNEIKDLWIIHNRVRAFSPEPGAYFWIQLRGKKKRLKVLCTHIDESLRDGDYRWKCTGDGFLLLSSSEGSLIFDLVQLEGKSIVSSKEFLQGFPLNSILFL